MKEIKIAIMSPDNMREYTLQIAKGQINPGPNAAKIFFPSMRAMAEAFNENNQALMAATNKYHPKTVSDYQSPGSYTELFTG